MMQVSCGEREQMCDIRKCLKYFSLHVWYKLGVSRLLVESQVGIFTQEK